MSYMYMYFDIFCFLGDVTSIGVFCIDVFFNFH